MPKLVRVQFFTSGGVPATGLTPVVSSFDKDGGALTALLVSEESAGVYVTQVPDADVATGAILVWNGGVGSLPRYQVSAASQVPMLALLLLNADGSLYSGVGSVGFYSYDPLFTGAPVPDVHLSLSPYLYAVLADEIDHVGIGTPADAFPLVSITTGVQFITPSPPVAAPLYGVVQVPPEYATAPVRDLAFDKKTGRFFRDDRNGLVMTRGPDAVRQAVERHFCTLRGEWFADVLAGFPWFERVLVKGANLPALRTLFRDEIESVQGVDFVSSLTLTFEPTNRKLRVDFEAFDDEGELVSGGFSR